MRHPFLTRALALAVVSVAALAAAATADAARYMVVYNGKSVPGNAGREIERAGGTLVWSYDRIGVAIADSDDPAFLDRLDGRTRVSVAEVDADADDDGDVSNPRERRVGRLPNVPATDSDTFSSQQWDMEQIGAPAAHAITGGSPAVLAADLDTGVDYTHPDLKDNLDLADSASCLGGVPDQAADPATGRFPYYDTNGHGTHTAGTIAAADNGIGVVGVAPNIRLAAVKVVDSSGMIFPEAVVCGYMWAAAHGVDVANASFGIDRHDTPADPARKGYFCQDDPADRPIITAVARAARYALKKGTTLVASAGNNNTDLASPPPGDECLRLPVELPGVIGVSSVSRTQELTYNSNYGLGVIDLTAPGGDPFDFAPPAGLVLSTLPGFIPPNGRSVIGDGGGSFGWAVGTSQAAPHVTGAAALVISRFGDSSPGNGRMKPKRVERILEATATPLACPANPYVRTTPAGTFTATCATGDDQNGFFGHGEVNALAAVQADDGR